MKKILIVLLVLAATASAGSWSAVSGMMGTEIKPTSTYQLDVSGTNNNRVYEFTTKNGMNCIAYYYSKDNKQGVELQCVKK